MYRYLIIFHLLLFCVQVQAGVTVVVHSGSAALFDAQGKLKSSSKLEKGMAFELPSSFNLRTNLSSDLAFWSQTNTSDIKTIPGKGSFARIIVNGREEWISTNKFYELTLTQKTANSQTEAGAPHCDGIDCLLKKVSPNALQPAAAKSANNAKAVVAHTSPPAKKIPSLNYTFEECYSFISQDGSYGEYGRWSKEELQRYKHVWGTSFAAQVMSSGSLGCANFKNLTDDEKIHFFIAVTQDLAATESKCGHNYTSVAGINPNGSAIGLLQLDNDFNRDKSVKGNPRVMDQKNIRNENATGVADTCVPMEWPSGYAKSAMYLNGARATVQSMHNPRANIRCGIGTLMRMIGEGKHPGHAGGFGPWLSNKQDRNLPFVSARAIFSKHPLCRVGAK